MGKGDTKSSTGFFNYFSNEIDGTTRITIASTWLVNNFVRFLNKSVQIKNTLLFVHDEITSWQLVLVRHF